MIERGQLVGRGVIGIEDRGDQPIQGFGSGHAVQTVLDDAHHHAIGLVPTIVLTGMEMAQVRAAGQTFGAGQADVLLDPSQQFGAGAAHLPP
jgi:hypothetical protein